MSAITSSLPIYIYASETKGTLPGTICISPECLNQMKDRLKEFEIDSSRVIEVKDSSILERELTKCKEAVLIIPGGHFVFLAVDLEKSINKIQLAISKGWNYFGSCSGANLGSRTLIYKLDMKNQDYRDDRFKFLNLLEVNAQYPVYSHASSLKVDDVGKMISITSTKGEQFSCYWNEGSQFTVLGKDVKTEACYSEFVNAPIAAVSGTYGKGNVFLTGIHPEILPDTNKSEFKNLKKQKDFIDAKRTEFLKRSFQYVKIL